MAIFNDAFALTMKAEGGYANDPQDRGGETYKGVSRNNHPTWSGWKIIDEAKAAKPKSLNAVLARNAVLQQKIKDFYKVNYWDVNNTGDINDQQVANQVFDIAVNSGAGTAAKFLQVAAGVTVDRVVGPLTIKAVNAANTKALYEKLLNERSTYFDQIVARNPSQSKFLASWKSRLTPYHEQA
jgi:lysozyme family protein